MLTVVFTRHLARPGQRTRTCGPFWWVTLSGDGIAACPDPERPEAVVIATRDECGRWHVAGGTGLPFDAVAFRPAGDELLDDLEDDGPCVDSDRVGSSDSGVEPRG